MDPGQISDTEKRRCGVGAQLWILLDAERPAETETSIAARMARSGGWGASVLDHTMGGGGSSILRPGLICMYNITYKNGPLKGHSQPCKRSCIASRNPLKGLL